MDNFDFTNAGKPNAKIKFKQAIKCVRDRENQIKKAVSKLTKKSVLKVPLEGPAAHIASRKADYEDVKEDISKWEPIVLANRKAKQLVFPLRQHESIDNAKDLTSRLEPLTDMEKEVKQMLDSSDNVINENRVLTAAEERYLKAMCIEEARERHRKLQKMRALLSYQEAKFKRQKKIKSKRYRRLLKKEKLAKQLKEFDEAKQSNSGLVLQKLEELDKLRALERASLKHKKTGKWSKHHKLRAKYDETARQALAEEATLSQKLTAKVRFEDEKNDEEINNEVNEDDVQAEMLGANEFDAFDLPEDNPWFRMDKNSHENFSKETVDYSQDKSKEKTEEEEKEIDPKQILMFSGKKIGSTLPDLSQMEDDVEDENEEQQTKLIAEAFAGDDVINEFIQEKKQDIEESKDKDICLYLPGWGSWVGPGIKENLKKKKSMTIKATKKKRKDDKLGNVILSEKRDETIAKYQVKELPISYNNAIVFEKSLKKPIGSAFNPETIFKQKIEPKLLTKMGAIIEPMNRSALSIKRKPLGYFKGVDKILI